MVSLNGRLFNISGYNFYREITPEHPRQFHMGVALGIGLRFEKKS